MAQQRGGNDVTHILSLENNMTPLKMTAWEADLKAVDY